MKFPNTVDDLIAELDRRFPEPLIAHDDTMDKIKFEAGQRSVISHLKQWRKSASEPPPAKQKRGSGRVRSKNP